MASITSLVTPATSGSDQRAQLRLRRLALVIVALCLGPLLLALVKLQPALDLRFESALGHFSIVTLAASIAVALAGLILWAAVTRQDGRVLLIGCAFLGISSIFLIHAIATPTIIFASASHAVMWSTPVALMVGAVLLAFSASDRFAQQPWLLRYWRVWLLCELAGWLLYSGFMLVYVPQHSLLPAAPATTAAHAAHAEADEYGDYGSGGAYDSPAPVAAAPTLQSRMLDMTKLAFTPIYGLIILLYCGTALRYAQRWRATPTRPLAVMTIGAVLLAETSVSAYVGITWQVSFWLYHVLLVVAVCTVTYGIVGGYGRGGGLSSAVSGLLLRSTMLRQQAAVRGAMGMLLDVLEQGRTDQVPLLRGELSQRFGLASDQLDLVEHAVLAVAHEREQADRLRALTDVGRAATLDLDPGVLLRDAVAIFGEIADARLCAIGLLDAGTLRFRPEHRYAPGTGAAATGDVCVDSATFAWAGQAAALRIAPLPAALAALGQDNLVALQMPLQHHERVLGLLVVQPQPGGAIDERLIAVCRSLCSQLASALANARLWRQLQDKHEAMRQSEEAREQLTQMVVHDLKNPLTAIRGFVALLQMTTLTPDQLDLVRGADRSSATMLQLVTDILDIARLQEGRLELRDEPVAVGALLLASAAELQVWADQAGKSVSVAVPPSMPPLLLDLRLMARVLSNLLSNALKHTPAGTQITLGGAVEADAVRLWVRDTGRGIAPDVASRLFERFSATPSSGEAQSNTGLGLTFCKLVVEAHGGAIGVESVPDIGTTFTITLPLARIAAYAPAAVD